MLHATHWKYTTQKLCKKSPAAHHCTTLSGYIFATTACVDNWKKNVKQQHLLHMSLEYGELQPTNGWDWSVSLGHPRKCQWVSRLGFVTAPTSLNRDQPNFAWCLGCYIIYTFLGSLAPNRILPGAKFTLRWILGYCTALKQWTSAKHCSVVSSRDRAAIAFDTGRSNCLVCFNCR